MSETVYDVLVIGAGVSGLRASSELKNLYGFSKIKVLEARHKIGGRVQQDHTFIPGRQLELGAEFIHGDINPVVELCEANGWTRKHIFTWSHGDGGPAEGPAPDGGIGYYWIGKEKKLLRFDAPDQDMKKCNEALWNLQKVDRDAAEADKRSLRQYLVDEGVPDRMLGLADAGYGNTAGGTADTVPATRAMRYERAWHGDGTDLDPDFRLEPSFSVLIDHLSKGLDIEVNSPVASVQVNTSLLAALNAKQAEANNTNARLVVTEDQEPSFAALDISPAEAPCAVTTKDGRVYRAARVLVTVPLPVMRDEDIIYDPPLSAEKVAAAKSCSFANGVKIVLKFSRRAWPRNCHGIVAADSLIPEMWMNSSVGVGGVIKGVECQYPASAHEYHHNTNKPKHAGDEESGGTSSRKNSVISPPTGEEEGPETDPPGTLYVVTGFIMGTRADALLRENTHEEILTKLVEQIDTMFGRDAKPAYMEGFVHNWGEEPYIRGAYSTPTVNESVDAARLLAENHLGAVFFAGEATAGAVDGRQREKPQHRAHYAPPIVLHGAMNTGTIAACELARSLGLPITCTDEGHAHFVPTYRFEDDSPIVGKLSVDTSVPVVKTKKSSSSSSSGRLTPCSAIRKGQASAPRRSPVTAGGVSSGSVSSPTSSVASSVVAEKLSPVAALNNNPINVADGVAAVEKKSPVTTTTSSPFTTTNLLLAAAVLGGVAFVAAKVFKNRV